MRLHTDTNIFACFVSYPSLVADVSEQTKDEAIKKGDMFRSYIWGEAGLDRFLKKIQYSDYGQDLKRILFQFYVLPCDYERVHITLSYISEQLGHTSIRTTQAYLAGFGRDARAQNARILTSFLSTPGK